MQVKALFAPHPCTTPCTTPVYYALHHTRVLQNLLLPAQTMVYTVFARMSKKTAMQIRLPCSVVLLMDWLHVNSSWLCCALNPWQGDFSI